MSVRLELEIALNSKGAVSGVKLLNGAVDDLEKTSKKADKAQSGLAMSVFKGMTAYDLAKKAAKFFVGEVKDSIKAAMESEKAERSLSAALEATGRPVKELSAHFNDYAAALQNQTIYDDEAIKGAQALLIQLTNLDRDGIDRATKGAIGLASVMGMDLSSAATIVAKAMAGNTSMLSRYGIQIDTTKTKEEQRAQAMEKLEGFYTRATADTETFSGKLKQLGNSYDEVQEAVGRYVTQNTHLITNLKLLADEVSFYLNSKDREHKQLQTLHEQYSEFNQSLYAAGEAMGWSREKMDELVDSFDASTPAVMRAINRDAKYADIKKKIAEMAGKEREAEKKLNDEKKMSEKGTNVLIDTENTLAKAEEKHFEAYYQYIRQMRDIDKARVAYNDTLEESIPRIVEGAEVTKEATEAIEKQAQKIAEDQLAYEEWLQSVEDISTAFSMLSGVFDDMLPGLGSISQGFSGIAKAVGDGAISMTGFLDIGLSIISGLTEALGNQFEAAQKMYDNILSMIAQANLLLANSAIEDALESLNNGTLPTPSGPGIVYKGDRPNFSAASGFHSEELPSDTIVQLHKGEKVDVTPAAQVSSGGGNRVTYLNITITGSRVTPEDVADAAREAYHNNTRGFRSLMEH